MESLVKRHLAHYRDQFNKNNEEYELDMNIHWNPMKVPLNKLVKEKDVPKGKEDTMVELWYLRVEMLVWEGEKDSGKLADRTLIFQGYREDKFGSKSEIKKSLLDEFLSSLIFGGIEYGMLVKNERMRKEAEEAQKAEKAKGDEEVKSEVEQQ